MTKRTRPPPIDDDGDPGTDGKRLWSETYDPPVTVDDPIPPSTADDANAISRKWPVYVCDEGGICRMDTPAFMRARSDTAKWQTIEFLELGQYYSERTVDDLPDNLRSLHVSGEKINEFPDDLPYHIEQICWTHTRIRRVPCLGNYAAIRDLTFRLNDIQTFGGDLPPFLTTLFLAEAGLHSLPDLPESVEEVFVASARMSHFPDVSHCTRMRSMKIVQCPIERLGELPASLTELKLSNMPRLTEFPEWLVATQIAVLELDRTGIRHVPDLRSFVHLKRFKCVGNPLHSVAYLPEGCSVETDGDRAKIRV